MQFHDHAILFDYLKREFPDLVKEGQEKFYRRKLIELEAEHAVTKNRHCITAYNQAHAEWFWNKLGRPYFKVYPNLLPMFMKTKLSVPGKYLHSPFSDFLIRLPENHGCKDLTVRDHELRTILVTEANRDETRPLDKPVEHSHMFIVWMNFGETYQNIPYYTYQVMKFAGEKSIEESIEEQRTPEKMDTQTLNYGLDIGIDKINNAIRLVVSTCFLATGADRIVEPDVLTKDLQQYIEAKRNEKPEKIKQLHDRAQRRGKRGWTLGREISIPGRSTSHHQSEPTGQHLSYQHQRGAHFHIYHYGPKKSKWKVQWVRQLTVRPDLPPPPVQTKKGYKVT